MDIPLNASAWPGRRCGRRARDSQQWPSFPMLERIYIGRRFRNDTERLEKLFELYTKMTAQKRRAS